MSSSDFNYTSDLITALFNRYKYNMQRIAHGILNDSQLAEDVVSEAMIKIIKNIDFVDNIDSRRCANFVYTITKNTALDFYRKKKRDSDNCVTFHESDYVNNIKDIINYEVFEEKYGFGEQIQRYMENLEEVDIDIIGLKYGDGFTYKEISLMLNMTEDMIRQRALRAKRKLERAISKEE